MNADTATRTTCNAYLYSKSTLIEVAEVPFPAPEVIVQLASTYVLRDNDPLNRRNRIALYHEVRPYRVPSSLEAPSR